MTADAEWLPLPAVSTPADADEREQVPPLIDRKRRLVGGKGYDSEVLRKNLRSRGIQPHIPRKKNARARSLR
ncbi:MAG: transposase [Candidatus Electronema sp. V4]|uniref:transposase n=1 Tax=Candidatus Electronema sp. V4 TaxID=3454756 RepID=UPI0040556DED